MSNRRTADFGCNSVTAWTIVALVFIVFRVAAGATTCALNLLWWCRKSPAEMSAPVGSKPSWSRSGPRPCLQGAACVNAYLLSCDVTGGV
jgi:hypothetical protein